MPTIDELLAQARPILRASTFDVAPREAVTLLAHVLGVDEVRIRTHGEELVDGEAASRYLDRVRRRAAGEPAAYLLGRREFYGREFRVDRRVLVPRPETEHLVEEALAVARESGAPPRVLDVGTGSGCLAVTLALERPAAHVTATDLSLGALDVARANARCLGARVDFVRADLTAALRLDAFDVVVSNPPYVAEDAASSLSVEVTGHEPHLALFAPERGTAVLEELLRAASAMRPGAWLLLEIGSDQGDWITGAVAAAQYLELRRLVRDYAGHLRTAVMQRTARSADQGAQQGCAEGVGRGRVSGTAQHNLETSDD